MGKFGGRKTGSEAGLIGAEGPGGRFMMSRAGDVVAGGAVGWWMLCEDASSQMEKGTRICEDVTYSRSMWPSFRTGILIRS